MPIARRRAQAAHHIAVALALATCATPACVDNREAFSGTVCLTVRHHGVTPASATVWRNYGEQFPGYGGDLGLRFDERAEMGPAGRVCFDSLGPGTYWFAAEGFDAFIGDSVRGSKRVEISTLAREYEVELSVSEQH